MRLNLLVIALALGCHQAPEGGGEDGDGDGNGGGETADTGTGGSTWEPPDEVVVDRDLDGFDEDADCDDLNPGIFPGATETCDGLDEDCDGAVDDDAIDVVTGFPGADLDGWGDDAAPITACELPVGSVLAGGDCDDLDAARHPGAAELCDGVDQDCDAATTEDHLVSVGDRSFASLQDALDAADEGDVVTACDGTYAENVAVTVSVTLTSLNGPEVTILDAGGAGRGLTVDAVDFTLSGFTVRNGSSTARFETGGGLDASFADVVVEDCVFEDNEAESGGALASYEGTLTVSSTDFVGNHAELEGGAISAFHTPISVTGGSFDGNSSGSAAGAIDGQFNPSIHLDSVTFAGNTSRDGGAIVSGGYQAADEIVSCTFTGNSATGVGGAVHAWGDLDVTGSTFTGNAARQGGALALQSGATLDGVTVTGNTADDIGGGLLVEGDASVTGSTITANVAGRGGGGAAMIYTWGRLRSTGTDWGTGATENLPDDVLDDDSGARFVDGGADFVCTAGVGCR